MTTIKFYYMPESPPCRAVEMAANLAGVTLDRTYVNLFTREHLSDESLKLNPFHRVPFIVDGDLKLNESRAIMGYLVNKYMPKDNTLYPHDPVERARVDEILQIDIGVFYQAASNLLKPMILGPVKKMDPEKEKDFREILTYFENRLQQNGGKKFMLGDHITIADISLVASFSFPEACEYDISEFKHLTAYIDRLKTSIPKYGEINDGPVNNMRNFIKSKQGGQQ